MKLIMENWRGYLAESEKAQDYGHLYLFEGDDVQKVSFYDRLMSLNESENDFDAFFEQWERSANYELDRLDEADKITLRSDPILYLSYQAYEMVKKAGSKILKYWSKIKAILDKAGGFLEKYEKSNPKLYAVGSLATKVAVAAAAVAAVQLLQGGGEAQAGDLLDWYGSAGFNKEVLANSEQLAEIGSSLQQSEYAQHRELGAKLVELSQSAENMKSRDLAAAIEGLDVNTLDGFIEKSVDKLENWVETDVNAGVTDRTGGNLTTQAIHAIGQALNPREGADVDKAIQALIDLQAGGLDALQGVDIETVIRQRGDEGGQEALSDLINKLQPDTGAAAEVTGAQPDPTTSKNLGMRAADWARQRNARK